MYKRQALDDAGIVYEVDQQNASGDQSACQTVASKFANEKKDLILAIATPAAQAMVGAVEDTPVLITAVTDPAAVSYTHLRCGCHEYHAGICDGENKGNRNKEVSGSG